jgi:hypothetical protein
MGIGSDILAATGYQVRVPKAVLYDTISAGFSLPDKSIPYIQRTLRGGVEIQKQGGHVTKSYQDYEFRLLFDNRRKVMVPEAGMSMKLITMPSGEKVEIMDLKGTLLGSGPLLDVGECLNLRYVSRLGRLSGYNKHTSISKGGKYKNNFDLAVRQLVRGIYSGDLGIDRSVFPKYADFLN